MSDDRDLDRAVSAVVVGIASGAYAILQGLITFDPSFLLSGVWIGPATMFSKYIGPEIIPGVPWSVVTLVIATASILATFYKYSQRRKQQA
jgi:hypothetical protein